MVPSSAPGALEEVRAFINTVEIAQVADPLGGDDSLGEWCDRTGLCRGASKADLAELRRFREALRSVLEANVREGESAGRWSALQPFAGRAGFRMSITPEGALKLEPSGSDSDAAVSAVLAIAYDAVARGTWSRLKACRKHDCRWAFYDRSKNGSGAWCSMAVCGNRVKAQRRRTREKSHENGPKK